MDGSQVMSDISTTINAYFRVWGARKVLLANTRQNHDEAREDSIEAAVRDLAKVSLHVLIGIFMFAVIFSVGLIVTYLAGWLSDHRVLPVVKGMAHLLSALNAFLFVMYIFRMICSVLSDTLEVISKSR
jgi:hypothetical protein